MVAMMAEVFVRQPYRIDRNHDFFRGLRIGCDLGGLSRGDDPRPRFFLANAQFLHPCKLDLILPQPVVRRLRLRAPPGLTGLGYACSDLLRDLLRDDRPLRTGSVGVRGSPARPLAAEYLRCRGSCGAQQRQREDVG